MIVTGARKMATTQTKGAPLCGSGAVIILQRKPAIIKDTSREEKRVARELVIKSHGNPQQKRLDTLQVEPKQFTASQMR